MDKLIYESKQQMSFMAAKAAAEAIQSAIASKGSACIALATGSSQLEMINILSLKKEIDFSKVILFQLDEYLAINPDHPASSRTFLKQRFLDEASPLKQVHFIHGNTLDVRGECDRLENLIRHCPIDVMCLGIGENGHVAFNDPPADFETEDAYRVVNLDETCRAQQKHEGWFQLPDEAVPVQAITMTIQQIMKSRCIIVTVPDERKSLAVKHALEGEISPACPASILQRHPNCKLFLDKYAASKLRFNFLYDKVI